MAITGRPIVERLDQVTGQWADFAERPDARVLCWLLAPDEHAMIDAFVAVEDAPAASQTQDLFVPLKAPFSPGRYGAALLAEFTERAAALHRGLEDPERAAWQPPRTTGGPDPLPFLQACQSFIEHYQLPGLLALVLNPQEIADLPAFRAWLDLVARTALPKLPKVRLVVRDDASAPALAPLVQAQPERVVAIPADLDMAAARLEISEDAGNLDKPGGQYRHAFVQMGNALGKQDLAAADEQAKVALAITACSSAEGWHALAVPIHLAMGASLAGAGKNEEANRRYLAAETSAAEGEKAGDQACGKLRVQTRLCRGTLLIHAGAWQLAATLYAETVPLAVAVQDPGMIIDCHRLASFCRERAEQWAPAWQHGVDGLACARTVDKAALASTQLAYLGVGLERLCKRDQYSGAWKRIEQELVALLGPTWRPPTPAAKGAGT
jgi:hypothetical protein